MYLSAPSVDRTRILSRSEITAILSDLRRKGHRSLNSRQNLIVVRLSVCAGLRVSEIAGLSMGAVRLGGKRPHIFVAGSTAKRGKSRKVPAWWDGSTLADLDAWKRERVAQGAKPDSPFVCCLNRGKHSQTSLETFGKPLSVRNLQARWKAATRVLGPERVKQLSIHAGRHSFCSHSLAGGRTLVEVRDAAGHKNVSTSSIYLHVVDDGDEEPGNLFDFAA